MSSKTTKFILAVGGVLFVLYSTVTKIINDTTLGHNGSMELMSQLMTPPYFFGTMLRFLALILIVVLYGVYVWKSNLNPDFMQRKIQNNINTLTIVALFAVLMSFFAPVSTILMQQHSVNYNNQSTQQVR